MLLQFSTGSVADSKSRLVQLSARNAGVQPSNVWAALSRKGSDEPSDMIKHIVKIPPQEEVLVFSESLFDDEPREVAIRVDSPSLILSLQVETGVPLGFSVELEDTWSWNQSHPNSPTSYIPLMWGYLTKGVPF